MTCPTACAGLALPLWAARGDFDGPLPSYDGAYLARCVWCPTCRAVWAAEPPELLAADDAGLALVQGEDAAEQARRAGAWAAMEQRWANAAPSVPGPVVRPTSAARRPAQTTLFGGEK
jgi:hypothetical protein